MKKLLGFLLLLTLILTGCGDTKGSNSSPEASEPTKNEVLKVASLIKPMTEILDLVKPMLAKEGIDLEIVILGDNVQPNTALASKEVDANFFQHVPYMEQFNEAQGAKLASGNHGILSRKN